MSDYNSLVITLQNFAAQARARPLSLGEVVTNLDEAAFALLAIILALPFMQPIPLGPFAIAAGFAFIALGWQLFQGLSSPSLPDKVSAIKLQEKSWCAMVKVCITFIGFWHKLTRPRHQYMVNGTLGRKLKGTILIAGGILLATPFPVPLPFNNTMPAIGVLIACIGELEEDGLMVYISIIWLSITALLFAGYYFSLWFFGKEAMTFLN